ncbi:MAG: sigma-54-dependent Fis family transcriptional regulator, partial [Planctomycetes bacterium]|nr:sigma-54-dependent Fis family transcriptional regulator [Planctomycetota bacterium]
ALDVVLEAAGGARGAVFLEGEPRVAASRGLGERGRISVDRLRTEALRAGTGPVAGGLCAGVQAPGGRRLGVLYLEAGAVGPAPDLQGFLEAAGVLLGEALARSRGASPASPPTGATPSGATTRAGTLSAESLASESPRMREVVSLIQRTRESRLPVLLTGESGCGKDHLARWIHSASTRRHGPFVAQDCSAIPAGLLEAEIFGYEAGAFTGAQRARTGYLLAAQGGTFYLDNVDSLSLEVQSKLVRVLESGGVRPLGGSAPVKVDVRWIASSQRDLRDLVERGEFRKDLFYRLSGICIEVPPLRERAEDVPLLVQHFREQIRGGGPEFTPGAIEVLRSHSWPGNVRELESVVRRLALTTETIVDERQVLRVLGLAGAPAAFPRWIFEGRSYEQAVEDVKREYLLHLFEAFEGDMDRVARELGTTRRNAYLRFSQAGIRPSELRAGRE